MPLSLSAPVRKSFLSNDHERMQKSDFSILDQKYPGQIMSKKSKLSI